MFRRYECGVFWAVDRKVLIIIGAGLGAGGVLAIHFALHGTLK
jgi:hypothetical protein